MFGHIDESLYQPIDSFGVVGTGNTPSTKISEYYENQDYCFIKPSDLNDSVTQLFDSEYKLDNRAEVVSRMFPKNTILVSCIGSIGKVAISKNEKSSCNQQINYVIPSEDVDPTYLAYAVSFNKNYFLSIANAPVVPIVNKTQFSKMPIPKPSYEEQLHFARFVQQVDKSKFVETVEPDHPAVFQNVHGFPSFGLIST